MSTYQFKLPDIGEGISEGTVAKWYVKPGDQLKEDVELLEIENDKSVEELTSPVAGTVKQILIAEGQTATVGQVLVELEVASEGSANETAPAAASAPATKDVKQKPQPQLTKPAPVAETVAKENRLPVLAMPSVRAFARQKEVDLTKIKGTGRHGQVTKQDVEKFLQSPATEQPTFSSATTAGLNSMQPLPPADEHWPQTREKMSAIRRATAQAMIRSQQNIPQVTVFDEVVVDKLWQHRQKFKLLAKQRGIHLTFLAYVVKTLTVILKEFPVFNAQTDLINHEIVYNNYINIGIATDTDRGLLIPNIKHADQLSLFDIAREITANTQKAQAGKLAASEMQHTGMTITNIGSLGGGFFTPIINWPESAILGLGKITKVPAVIADQLQLAYVLKISLSFDHRLIDGATAQQALNRFKELISDPELLLMEG